MRPTGLQLRSEPARGDVRLLRVIERISASLIFPPIVTSIDIDGPAEQTGGASIDLCNHSRRWHWTISAHLPPYPES
jgi:hypothetical protein